MFVLKMNPCTKLVCTYLEIIILNLLLSRFICAEERCPPGHVSTTTMLTVMISFYQGSDLN